VSAIAAAIIGGAALTAGAGYATAQSQQSAANRNQVTDQNQLYLNMARQALALYGPEKGKAWVQANIPQDRLTALFGTTSKTKESLAGKVIDLGGTGGGLYNSTLGALGHGLGGLFGTGGKHTTVTPPQNNLDAMAATAGPGALGQMSALGEQQIAAQGAQANAMEGLVANSRGYGNAMAAQINRDAAQQLAQVNAATTARARAAGISGSSIEGNQDAANAASIFQAKQDALTGLNMGVQNRTLGLQQNVIGQNLSNAASATALRMNPIQTNLGFLSGQTFNPYVPGQYPGVSPLGNAANSLGNTATGYGGMQLGQQNAMQFAASLYGQGNQPYNPGPYSGGQMSQMLGTGGGSTSGARGNG
jgi:hypothetical protein